MRRRDFIQGIFGSTVTWPLVAHAQAKKVLRIGMLDTAPETINAANLDAFRQQLNKLGYIERQNLVIEYRFSANNVDDFPRFAAELARLKVDVIVTRGTPAVLAAKNITSSIPVVMAASGDPVKLGIVTSLARPGGKVTGLTSFLIELTGKRIELMKEMIPNVSRIGFVDNMANSVVPILWEEFMDAARSLRLETRLLDVQNPQYLERAFNTATAEGVNALFVGNDGMFTGNRQRVVNLAFRHRIPALFHDRAWPDAGGLVSYGVDFYDLYRRAAIYVDKIFKGANPAELPIEQPSKLNFVINLKTAKAINLTIPPLMLTRADEVIE